MFLTPEEKVAPGNAALLLVDVQNDFLHEKGFSARHSKMFKMNSEMPERLERLLDKARQCGVMPIFIRNTYSEHTLSPVQKERIAKLWPGIPEYICQDGSWGIEFYRVAPRPGEVVVTKHRYSAFINTDLDLILRSNGIKAIIITGVATSACVEATARHGWMLDYYIVVAGDCCGSQDAVAHETSLRNMGASFATVLSSEEIVKMWERGAGK